MTEPWCLPNRSAGIGCLGEVSQLFSFGFLLHQGPKIFRINLQLAPTAAASELIVVENFLESIAEYESDLWVMDIELP